MKAAEKEIDLQELCVRYLEAALARDDSKPPAAYIKK